MLAQHKTGPWETPLLDLDFDEDGGTKCAPGLHPDAWGIHDGDGVVSDKVLTLPYDRKPANAYYATRKKREADEMAAEQADYRNRLFVSACAELRKFPHVNELIALQVAGEWSTGGRADAAARGLSDHDWLWKRSRYLAI